MQTDTRTGAAVDQFPGRYDHKTVSVAAMFFIGLQCMDLLTTLMAFSRGGIELNPVVRTLMPWTGRVLAVFASKAILTSVILLYSRRKRILYLGNILYTAVVAWNLFIVIALR